MTNAKSFTKRTLDNLPAPRQGERAIYICQDKRYLKIRLTPAAKTFFYQRTVKGKQETVTIGKYPDLTPTQAKDKADAINAENVMGESVQSRRSAKRNEMTFGELWEEYRHHRPRKRDNANSRSLDHQWRKYLSKWSNRRLSDISHDEAWRFIKRLRQRVPGQANRVHTQAKAMYNFAVRELKIAVDNPFAFSKPSEKHRRRVKTASKGELKRLFEALDELESQTAADIFRLCIYTAQRVGNVRAMRFVDCDLEDGVWYIQDTKQGQPLAAALSTPAIDLIARRQRSSKSQYVFPGRRPDAPIREYKTAWRRVLSLAEIEDLRVHDLRHIAATKQHEAGIVAQIQKQLGHATPSMTQSYIHSEAGTQRLMMDAALANMLGDSE